MFFHNHRAALEQKRGQPLGIGPDGSPNGPTTRYAWYAWWGSSWLRLAKLIYKILTMVMGDLWVIYGWFMGDLWVIYGDLWWFMVIYGDLWWFIWFYDHFITRWCNYGLW